LSGFGEDLDAHVAALFGSFVGLLGEHCALDARLVVRR